MRIGWIGVFALLCGGVALADEKLTPEQAQFFESKVRPIFVANCYKCHSVEQGKAKGKLVLDSKEGWSKGGSTGPAVVPGDPEKSLLIKAIRYTDPDLQMPPKGEKLSDAQVADLTTWVKMGAPDPRVGGTAKLTGLNDKARAHWAYQPVKKPEVPQVKDKKWVKTPVDAFVLAKLEENGMKPSRPAQPAVLLRRVYYDLVGLPPTPQEIRAFLFDRSPNALEKVVDKLLASPHYGERWGRYWLDSARYSDTSGAEQVRKEDYRYAYAWTYRDYVIKAFNQDKPYDLFLKEQLAADLLPGHEKDPDSLAALGFITVGKRFANPNDTIDERIDTVSKAMLGMTVSCARCHDHKFDPIPQMDYYSLHGIFSSIEEPDNKPVVGKMPSGPQFAEYQKKMQALEEKNREVYYTLLEGKSSEFRKKAAAYLMATLYQRRFKTADLTARNKLIADNSLERDVMAVLRPGAPAHQSVFLPLVWFTELGENFKADDVRDILERIETGGPRRRKINPIVKAAFKATSAESIKSMEDVAAVYGKIFDRVEPEAHRYIQANRTARSTTISGFEPAVVELLNLPSPVEPAPAITTGHLRDILSKLPVVNNGAYNLFEFNLINALEMTNPAAPGRAMIVEDKEEPKDSHVFIRGEANNKGPVAPRRFLEILAGPRRQNFKEGSGRLELAEAIASKENPITARVMVNRIWMHHFGEGFVRTPDDLGVQSEPPSHPELLDYLASRFMEEGWSIKKLHKLIILSAAYQQSSETDNAYAKKDPENRLLWRANLRRLDFEAIRDSMLVFSGKLDPTVGGKPVNLTDEPYSFRRSVYGYIDRGNLPELMGQFDFSDPDRANSKRTTTIVPQQALFFMNSPMSADVARKVISRPEFVNARDDFARVRAVYEVIYQREPRPEEVRFAAAFYNAHSVQERVAGASPTGREEERPQRNASGRNDSMMSKTMMSMRGAKRAIQNEGEAVSRDPLNIWEQYVQALLCTNEIAYVN